MDKPISMSQFIFPDPSFSMWCSGAGGIFTGLWDLPILGDESRGAMESARGTRLTLRTLASGKTQVVAAPASAEAKEPPL